MAVFCLLRDPAWWKPFSNANTMWCNKWILLWLLLGFSLCVGAQNLPDIENLLESNDIERTAEGYEEMLNTLLSLAVSPVNLNTAGFDSLKMLYLLSDGQIDQILKFRQKYGNFLHLNELLLVPGIGRRDLENISPFVTVGQPALRDRFAAVRARTKHELLTKVRGSFPLQEGYTRYHPRDFDKKKDYERKLANHFQGPPLGTLIKYKFSVVGHLQAGITLENDPGEAYFTRNQQVGFDFLSAHIAVTTKNFIRQVLIGDYRLQWGQGLVAWGGFASGKSDVTVGNEKAGKGFVAYTSTDENNYLRGIAVSFKVAQPLTADLFFSKKKTDGNLLSNDTLAEEDLVSVSLYESGYHRNDNECRKKHTLKELTTGIALRWNTSGFRLGMNALYYDFTPSLIPGDRVYQQYNDKGKRRFLMSIDYKTSLYGFYLFGETARSETNAWATLNGIRWGNSFLSACLLYRRYHKKYVSRYASGFGEYSNTSNEEGVYLGFDLSLIKNLKLNFYYDWFRFFSPRYQASTPGSGWEMLGEATYRQKHFEHSLRIKHEVRPEDAKDKTATQRMREEYRYQFNYFPSRQWEFRTRFSVSGYRKETLKEKGYLVYQDVIFANKTADLKMQYRLAWFDTDSYQSRIYTYENNVLYGYSFPSFIGQGWRTYLNLTWKPLRKLTCYLKSGFIYYPHREEISSGLTKVKGNKLYDITIQLRLSI